MLYLPQVALNLYTQNIILGSKKAFSMYFQMMWAENNLSLIKL